MDSPGDNLIESIKKRYIAALIFIGLSALAACICLRIALSRSESTALIVNISGRQRMLSQRLGLDALKVYNSFRPSDQPIDDGASKSLLKHSTEMQSANKKLSSGNLSKSVFHAPSKDIRNLYFGETNLSQRVNEYSQLAIQLSHATNEDKAKNLAKEIIALAPDLLRDLDAAVDTYQKEGETKIAFVENIAWISICLIIVLLYVEAKFIFRPILDIVTESRIAEASRIDELSEKVELRTIKLEKANLKLRELATHDQLTGLKNRSTLLDDIELLNKNFQRNSADFSIAFIDIDLFKTINDNHGHLFGDFILKEFSDFVSSMLREYDNFYRIGGEEFLILFRRGELDAISSKLEDLREKIQNHDFIKDNVKCNITFSCGLFHSSQFKEVTCDEILNIADKALYNAKNSGRNKISIAGNINVKH